MRKTSVNRAFVNTVNSKFVPGYVTKTVDGHTARVICVTNDNKLLVFVQSFLGSHENRTVKYTLDGFRWGKSSPSNMDLAEAA